MATGVIEVATSYTAATTNAVSANILHDVTSGFGGQDLWGHWTIRCTARKATLLPCAHFYQRVSGIWMSATGLVLTGTQPAMESEKDATLSAVTMAVTASGDDLEVTLSGIAATNLNWFLTVVTHNAYAEN